MLTEELKQELHESRINTLRLKYGDDHPEVAAYDGRVPEVPNATETVPEGAVVTVNEAGPVPAIDEE
jgi:hypothetical protein